MKKNSKITSLFHTTTFPWVYRSPNSFFFGGNQLWFARRTAASSGCGVIACVNSLLALALKYPKFAYSLKVSFRSDDSITLSSYQTLMEAAYKEMKTTEIPFLNTYYDSLPQNKELPFSLKANLGMNLWHYIIQTLLFAHRRKISLKSNIFLTGFVNYDSALSYLCQGIKRSGSVTLITTLNSHYLRVFSSSDTCKDTKISKHFTNICGIRRKENGKIELLVSTWGNVSTIDFDDLFSSWQTYRSIYSGMVYFTPAAHSAQTFIDIAKMPFYMLRSIFLTLKGFLRVFFNFNELKRLP